MPFSTPLNGIFRFLISNQTSMTVQTLNKTAFGIPLRTSAFSSWTTQGAGLALLLVIAANFFVPGGHDVQRSLEIVFLLAFGGAMLARPGTLIASLPRGKILRFSLTGFFLLGTVGSLSVFSSRFAFHEVASLLLLLLVGLVIANQVAAAGNDSMVRLLLVLGGICLLYAFKLTVVYFSVFVVGAQPEAADFTPGFNNYRFFNHTQTVILPIVVTLFALTPPKARMRWAWLLLATLWCALLAVTSARGTVLGLAVGCIVALALRGRHAFPFLKAMALSAVAGGAFFVIFFVLIPDAAGYLPFGEMARTVERSTNADPTSGRTILWTRSFELIAAHPLLGVGPMHFAHHAVDVRIGAHPHNWLLQIAAEWGLPALLCLCVAIGAAALGLVRTGARIAAHDLRNQNILTGLIVAGAALLADGLVSGTIVMPLSQLVIALYIGCAAGWSRTVGCARCTVPAPAGPARRAVAAAIVVAAMLGLANGVWPEIGPRYHGEPLTAEQKAANGPGIYWPRLWHVGYF